LAVVALCGCDQAGLAKEADAGVAEVLPTAPRTADGDFPLFSALPLVTPPEHEAFWGVPIE
jgi:hypothetical protein